MNESTVPVSRHSTPPVTPCSSTDHDGIHVPTTQRVIAHHADGRRVDTARCSYCGEGLVARLLRDGWVVTTWTSQTPATVPPLMAAGSPPRPATPQAGPVVTPTREHHGFIVAAVRGGTPVLAEGFAAHTDTTDEAQAVAAAWNEIGETVSVFELVEVTL